MHLGAEDQNRVYLGTDTHAFGLMLGATMALLLPYALASEQPERTAKAWSSTLGWLGLGCGGLAGTWLCRRDLRPGDPRISLALAQTLPGAIVDGKVNRAGYAIPEKTNLLAPDRTHPGNTAAQIFATTVKDAIERP